MQRFAASVQRTRVAQLLSAIPSANQLASASARTIRHLSIDGKHRVAALQMARTVDGLLSANSLVRTPSSRVTLFPFSRTLSSTLDISELDIGIEEEDVDGGNIRDNTSSLDDFDLAPKLRRNLEQSGIESLFPVQAQTFSIVKAGKDLIAKSPTGSGKTLAFVLPIIDNLIKVRTLFEVNAARCCLAEDCFIPQEGGGRGRGALPKCLVLSPTRELSNQISREFSRVTKQTGIRTTCIYGGVSYGPQRRDLNGGVEIVVGTPGRLIDLLNDGSIQLDDVRFLQISFVLCSVCTGSVANSDI